MLKSVVVYISVTVFYLKIILLFSNKLDLVCKEGSWYFLLIRTVLFTGLSICSCGSM